MFKLLTTALVLGVLAVGAVQVAGSGSVPTAYAADLDCDDFPNQAAAQAYYRSHPGDTDNLDSDDDGVACENLSDLFCPCDYAPVSHGYPGYNPPYYNPQYANYPYNNPYPYLVNTNAASRPTHLSLQVLNSSVPCNGETQLVARLTYPNGVGAPAHLVTFQSSLGTVVTNMLTDAGGYVTTKFTAPFTPSVVQITVFADGLTQAASVTVTCPIPTVPPLGVTYVMPSPIQPPSTGDGGLVASDSSSSLWFLLSAAVILLGAPMATLAVVKQRK